jgi:hypothetical protein
MTDAAGPIPAEEAARRIRQGIASDGLRVEGTLYLADDAKLTRLPANLSAEALDVSGCRNLPSLPAGLEVRRLNASGCTGLREVPPGLSCFDLELRETSIRTLPADLSVSFRIDLENCLALESLPTGLRTGTLILRHCESLRALPEDLNVRFLDILGCGSLREWPRRATVRHGRLRAARCAWLRELPSWLSELAQLDVQDCPNLRSLPVGLRVSSWIDLAGTGIRSLPAQLKGVSLLWRGVPIDERIAFRPETITADEILADENLERRRVLLERMGAERFLAEAGAKELDRDRDAGGERRLLRVAMRNDEDLVCVAVVCPSTGRQYLIRVPPTMRTCRHAVAWIAGFDNPNDYRPLAET